MPATPLHLDVEIHQLIELMRCRRPDDRHAPRVADEVAGGTVPQKLRMVGEDAAALRVIDIVFELHDAARALRVNEDLIGRIKTQGFPFFTMKPPNTAANARTIPMKASPRLGDGEPPPEILIDADAEKLSG